MIVEKVVLYIFASFDPTVTPPTKIHYWSELAPLERSLPVVNWEPLDCSLPVANWEPLERLLLPWDSRFSYCCLFPR